MRPPLKLIAILGIALAALLPLAYATPADTPGVSEPLIQGKPVQARVDALQDPDRFVRSRAAYALGSSPRKARKAIPQLIATLNDPEWAVRSAAAGSLGLIGSPDSVPALINAFKDSDPRVRASVAGALGRIEPPAKNALPELAEGLKDANSGVRAGLRKRCGKSITTRARSSL